MSNSYGRSGVFTVYTLRDRNGCIRYVGCTYQPNIIDRLKQHAASKSKVGDWAKKERANGRRIFIKPEFRFAYEPGVSSNTTARVRALECERRLINHLSIELGDTLLNRVCNPRHSYFYDSAI